MSFIQTEILDNVLYIYLNRPKKMNAINRHMCADILKVTNNVDNNSDVRCIVLMGTNNNFSVGADILELEQMSYKALSRSDYFSNWQAFSKIRTPKIAAVDGYALGGGCELAMMCDMIYASENATFSQPEINLGLIPGMGGTQRLTRLIGQAKAMDLILTGRQLTAQEAYTAGLVAQVFKQDDFLIQIQNQASKIAQYSKTALLSATESVRNCDQMSLDAGLVFERRLYHDLWNDSDSQEGMQAFLSKRQPKFNQSDTIKLENEIAC